MIRPCSPRPFLFVLAATAATLIGGAVSLTEADEHQNTIYELRTYYTHPGKLDALQARFRDHTVKLFEKHGMTNVGYWVPTANEKQILIYLMAYPNRESRDASWKSFLADPEWKAAYAKSTEDGKLVRKVDKVFLHPTNYSSELTIEAQDPARLFELRRYTTNEGKLPNLDARFRDHTISLFEKHGMNNLVYFHLAPGQEGSDNTLVYLIAHQDTKKRDASFEAFRLDPKWQKAREASEKEGKLLVKGGVESLLLDPVDYSPMK